MDRQAILQRLRKTDQQIRDAGIDWSELEAIRDDYVRISSRFDKLRAVLTESLNAIDQVHSIRGRIKDPDHVVEKCIRKQCDDPKRRFRVDNYRRELTDLVGVRVLHLYKHDWQRIHEAIRANWSCREKPVAFVREGDTKEIVSAYEQAELSVREHPAGYRSLHYVVDVSMPVVGSAIAEIQVRTVFEEGWSEVDHHLRYPHGCDAALVDHLRLFNRIAGSADEMASNLAALGRHLEERARTAAAEKAQLTREVQELRDAVTAHVADKARRDSLHGTLDAILASFGTLAGALVGGAALASGLILAKSPPDIGHDSDTGIHVRDAAASPPDASGAPPPNSADERTKTPKPKRSR